MTETREIQRGLHFGFFRMDNLWLWLILTALTWTAAVGFDRYQHRHAQDYLTTDLEEWVQAQEARVDELAAEELIIRTYLLDKKEMPGPIYTAFTERMVRMSELPFALFYTLHDSLIYWSKGVPGVKEGDLWNLTRERRLLRLADGWYLPRHKMLSDSIDLYALIPIKYDYAAKGAFLKSHFPANKDIPGEVLIGPEVTSHSIRFKDGNVLGYLDFSFAGKSLPREYLSLILFLLAGLITVISAHSIASALIQRGYRQLGPLLFLLVLFGLRIISIMLDFTGHFQQMQIFHRSMEHASLSHSIGDLLINISLLLWIIIFFYRELPIPDFSGLDHVRRWIIGFVNYLAIALGLLAIIHLFHILVLDSDITFRFDDIFNFNTFSFLSLLAVQLLLIALFLYSYRLLLFINQTALSRLSRLLALLLAAGVAFAAAMVIHIPVPAQYLVGILIGYLLLFEFYADVRVSNLTWTILWMILFSGLASGFLYHFNNTKVDAKLKTYANALLNPRDVILEQQLAELTRQPIEQHELIHHFYNSPYLKHYYVWHEIAHADTIMTGTWSWTFDTLSYSYSVTHPAGDTFRIERAMHDAKQVYVELLKTTPFKGIADLENFRYLLRKKEKNIQSTLSENMIFNLREQFTADKKDHLFRSKNVRGLVAYNNNFELMVTYESSGRSEFLSLFSYLFCLLTITLFLITLLNTLFSFLPDTLNFSLSHRLSLRNRIQFSVISLIVLSFLIIGVITIMYFKNTTQQYHQERLQRKALGVAKDLENQLDQTDQPDREEVEAILRSISRVHETDIDLFTDEGQLAYSSEPLVYTYQLATPLMDGRALAAMVWEGKSLFIGDSRIGQLEYSTAYAPLSRQSGLSAGYLAIPYYTDRSFLQKDISEFISALLNVYVFLLFIAGALAILVANSITFPISVIGEKLKQFKLGKQNEPLEWSSRDELGELIAEYNRMIRKLQESADMLARSEREGAWREMAKQVAHEIKNPLTPMKLSLQHLQHAFKPARQEDKDLLNRVSATLIEQIENLSQIASEFSNFAKIPEAHPEELIINELIYSIHNLFGENDQDGLVITTDLPEANLLVRADKNQLLRVLNNLVKNAMQAIPQDRHGRIRITLKKDGQVAVIAVQDNGSGIPPDMQEKVFMPNFTTKSSGTGLGLAICRNMVAQMQGRIYFQTQPGEGTTFFVEVPLA